VNRGNDQYQTLELLRREVCTRFGVAPGLIRFVRSPYRVCPLGAHVDHQLGPVTAMTLDRCVFLGYAPSRSRDVRLSSLDFSGGVCFSLDDVPGRQVDDWGNFPRGAARALQKRHYLERGIVGVVTGELHGGGVSSSAAVGLSFLLAFEDVNHLSITAEENIELDRQIENDFLGLSNGILDQAAILFSRRGYLTRIDCRTAKHELIPAVLAMPTFKILLVFSGLRKALSGTDYNRRVDECTEAARTLLAAVGRVDSDPVLGNVSPDEYAEHKHILNDALARRAAHFFSEGDRVRQGVVAWKRGDLGAFGALMNTSGESSIRNYECGSAPLIDLYHTMIETDGVYGARFSGAGFRGCCVALVEPQSLEQVADRVFSTYSERHPVLAGNASIVLCDTADGAAILGVEPDEPGLLTCDQHSLE
jgi:galacturonokinase